MNLGDVIISDIITYDRTPCEDPEFIRRFVVHEYKAVFRVEHDERLELYVKNDYPVLSRAKLTYTI